MVGEIDQDICWQIYLFLKLTIFNRDAFFLFTDDCLNHPLIPLFLNIPSEDIIV